MARNLGSIFAEMRLKLNSLERDVKEVEVLLKKTGDEADKLVRRFDDAAKKLQQAGKNMSKWITAPIMGIAGVATYMGMQFEKNMSTVQAVTGATGDRIKELEQLAIDLGASTVFSASEAAQAMVELGRAGFNTSEIIAAVPGLLDLAASGQLELAAASSITAEIIRAFGEDASEAARVADVLSAAANSANTTVEDLGYAMSFGAASAATAGQSIETTTAILATLANAGIDSTRAGTALTAMLRDLFAASEDGAIAVGETNIRLFDQAGNMRNLIDILADFEVATAGMTDEQRNMYLQMLFTEQSLRAVSTILQQGTASMMEFEAMLLQSQGTAKRTADVMMDNLAGALEELRGSTETLFLQMYSIAAPILTRLTVALTDVVRFLTQLPEPLKAAVMGVAALAAAIGPLLAGLGTLLTVLPMMAKGWTMVKTAMTSFMVKTAPLLLKIGLIVAAVTAIGLAAGLVVSNWEHAKGILGGIWDRIVLSAQSMGNSIRTIFEKMKHAVIRTIFSIVEELAILKNLPFGVGSAFENMSNAIGDSLSASERRLEELAAEAEDIKRRISIANDQIATSWANMKTGITEDVEAIINYFSGMAHAGESALEDLGESAVDVEGFMSELDERLKKLQEDLENVGLSSKSTDERIAELKAEIERLLEAGVDPLSEEVRNLLRELDLLRGTTVNVQAVYAELEKELNKNARRAEVLGDLYDGTARATSLLEKALVDLIDAGVDPTSERFVHYMNQLRQLRDEQDAVGGSARSVDDIFAELKEDLDLIANRAAVLGDLYDELGDRSRVLERAIVDLIDAGIDPADEQLQNLVAQLRDLRAEMEKAGTSTVDLEKIFADTKETLDLIDRRVELLGEHYDGVRDKTATLERALISLVDGGIDPADERFQDLIETLASLKKETDDTVDSAAEIEKVLAELRAEINRVDRRMEILGDEYDGTGEKIRLMEQALLDLIDNGIDPTDERFLSLIENIRQLKDELDDTRTISDVFKELYNSIAVVERRVSVLGDLYDGNRDKVRLLEQAIIELIDMGIDPANQEFQDLIATYRDLQDVTEDTVDSVRTVKDIFDEYDEALAKINRRAELMGSVYDDLSDRSSLLRRTLIDLVDAGVDPTDEKFRSMLSTLEKLVEQEKEVEEKTRSVKEIMDELKASLAVIDRRMEILGDVYDGNSEKVSLLNKAILELIDGGIDPADERLQDLIKQFVDLKSTLDTSTTSVRSYDDVMKDLRTELELLERRANLLGEHFDLDREKANVLRRALIELADLGVDPANAEVADLVAQLTALKEKLEQTEENVVTVDDIFNELNAELALINRRMELLGDLYDGISAKSSVLERSLIALVDAGVDPADAQFQQFMSTLRDLKKQMDDTGETTTTVETVLADLRVELEKINKRFALLGDLYDVNNEKARALENALIQLADLGVGPADERVQEFLATLRELRQENDDTADSVKTIQDIFDEFDESLAKINRRADILGTAYDDVSDRVNLLRSTVIDLIDNGIDPAHERFTELVETMRELEKALNDTSGDTRTAKQVYDDLDETLATIDRRMAALGDQYDGNKDKVNALRQALILLVDMGVDPASEAFTHYLNLLNELNPAQEEVTENVRSTADVFDELAIGIAKIDRRIELLGDLYDGNKAKVSLLTDALIELVDLGIDPADEKFQSYIQTLRTLQDEIANADALTFESAKKDLAKQFALIEAEVAAFGKTQEEAQMKAQALEQTIKNLLAHDFDVASEGMQELIAQWEEWSEKAEEAKKTVFDVNEALDEMEEKLEQAAVRSRIFGEEFNLLQKELEIVTATINTLIDEGFTEADEVLQQLIERMNILKEKIREASEETKNLWIDAWDAIADSMESHLANMLDGTESFVEGMTGMFQDLRTFFARAVAQMAVDWLRMEFQRQLASTTTAAVVKTTSVASLKAVTTAIMSTMTAAVTAIKTVLASLGPIGWLLLGLGTLAGISSIRKSTVNVVHGAPSIDGYTGAAGGRGSGVSSKTAPVSVNFQKESIVIVHPSTIDEIMDQLYDAITSRLAEEDIVWGDA